MSYSCEGILVNRRKLWFDILFAILFAFWEMDLTVCRERKLDAAVWALGNIRMTFPPSAGQVYREVMSCRTFITSLENVTSEVKKENSAFFQTSVSQEIPFAIRYNF